MNYKDKFLTGILLLIVSFSCAAQSPANLILINGKVFTADVAVKNAEAIAIAGDKIVGLGTTVEMKKLAGPTTRVIDLAGRTVVPGFNDAHTHFQAQPEFFTLQFSSMEPDLTEVQRLIGEAVKKVKPGEWIVGSIGGTAFMDQKLVRSYLDDLAPQNPVMLSTYYGHGTVVNSGAMAKLTISERQPDPAGGWYERGTDGRFNGRIFEYAQWRIKRQIADMVSDAATIRNIKEMNDEAASLGITSMQVMSFLDIRRFAHLLDKADISVRVRAIPFSMTTGAGRDLDEIRELSAIRPSNRKMRVSGIKWILDGTPFERGAAMRKAYADAEGNTGHPNFGDKELEAMLRESLKYRQQILFHAVGDRMIESIFDAMERVGAGKIDWPSKRVRIEHGDCLDGDLLDRAKRLGAVVVQNPTHYSLVEMLHARWSPQMSCETQRSFLDKGIPFALGSDGPMNPGLNIMFATIHPSRPTQAISREQAVIAYTAGSAYSEFAEAFKGTLTNRSLADLAVLSQDIFSVPADALPATTSVMTIVGGKIVHDAKVLN